MNYGRKGDLTLRFYVAYFLNPPELRGERPGEDRASAAGVPR